VSRAVPQILQSGEDVSDGGVYRRHHANQPLSTGRVCPFTISDAREAR